MPSFPTRLLEVLSKFWGVNVQQFLQVSCPTKSLGGGGGSCPTIFLVAAISGISFQQHPFWGGHLYFQTCGFFSQKNGTPNQTIQKITPTKNHDIWGRYPTYGNMGWPRPFLVHRRMPMHHQVHRSPAPCLSRTCRDFVGKIQDGTIRVMLGNSNKWCLEILTRTLVNLIKIDFLMYILCIIVHNTYDNTVQV